MADLLPRKAYKKVLKAVEHYRKQDEEDRRENPGAIPLGTVKTKWEKRWRK